MTAHWAAPSLKFEKEPDEISATGGHRVLSPIDVNDVLYRLSHATMLSYFRPTSPVGHLEQFVLTMWLKHQTVLESR